MIRLPKSFFGIRKITLSAVFLSVALVIKTFVSIPLPLFGEDGMRVSLSVIFTSMPAVLFGPFYGAAVSALSDFLGFHLKPTSGYIPLLTVSAAIGGFTRGLIWNVLKGKEEKTLKGAALTVRVLTAMLVSGLLVTTLNTFVLREFVIPSWKNISFFVLWVPRALKEALLSAVSSYFVVMLYLLSRRAAFTR